MMHTPRALGQTSPLNFDRTEFGCAVEDLMLRENAKFLADVPDADHLTSADELERSYYVRHRIETIKRIQITAEVDALALADLIREDYAAARVWARYACEELDHDRIFYGDLEQLGVTREDVDSTPLLAATADLKHYLLSRTQENGALAALAYSTFVEWNSQHFSRRAALKACDAFGPQAASGALAHCEIDLDLDHVDMMLDLAHRLCERSVSFGPFFEMIADISALFRRYFGELSAMSRPRPALA